MLVDEYIEHQIEYSKRYGKRTLVLMQNGSFYEIFGVNNTIEKVGLVEDVSKILNIQMTRQKKSILENSRKNALMAGFPLASLKKYVRVLLERNFTIVIIEQQSNDVYIERKVVRILSPGTYIDELNTDENKNILSFFIEIYELKIIGIGASVVDLSTGKTTLYEIHQTKDNCLWEECIRFIYTYQPSEILIYTSDEISKQCKEEIIQNLELYNKNYHIYKMESIFTKLSYQNEFLGKIFENTGMLSPIEYLNLERRPYTLMSYLLLLQYAYEHDVNIVNKLHKPCFWDKNKHLVLANNCICQLDLIPNHMNCYNQKYQSVFHVINRTSTAIGRRLLKNRLLSPINDVDKLNFRYNCIDEMLTLDMEKITSYLKEVLDIERLHRKFCILRLEPYELQNLYLSYKSIFGCIYFLLENKNIENISKIILDSKEIDIFKNLCNEINEVFILSELSKYTLQNIETSFFKKGYNKEIDDIQERINKIHCVFENIKDELSNIVEKNEKSKKSKLNKEYVKIKKVEKSENYYFYVTKRRCQIIKKYFEKNKNKNKNKNGNCYDNVLKDGILYEKLIYTSQKSYDKITSNTINNYSNKLYVLYEKMKKIIKSVYIETLTQFYEKYSTIFHKIELFVSNIDVIKSCALVSKYYKYCKPEVVSSDKGFIEAKAIRHPLVEKISIDTTYIPNDIVIGKDNLDGMLVYSVNACGKSTLMKSVGINIILAQAGMYVPAESFTFSPYHTILTRIWNNDNLFKGQSSFAVEMIELKSILEEANPRALILGDEICSGTEQTSGLSIVAASIIRLSKKKASFIFATHLHRLSQLDIINNLDNVKHFHLKVSIEDDKIIYHRNLQEGSGEDIYGIEVMKYIINDKEFIKLATKIRNEESDISSHIVNTKTSKYNKDIYVDRCQICGKKGVDTHHIKFQSEANEDGLIKHFHKNIKGNLVVLCNKCHNDVHHGNLEISGYIDSSNGKKLKYKRMEKKTNKKSKYNEKEITLIKKMKKENPLLTQKKASILLKNFKDSENNIISIKISPTTIGKIWNNKY